jgi:uncharacterized membrane protein
MRRCALFVLLGLIGAQASATPDILEDFKKASGNTTADCKVCHTKPPEKNPFGKAVNAALNKTNDGVLSKDVLEQLSKEDSDGDGISNGEEVEKKSLPGDSNSKPADPPKQRPLVPNHSFHPAVIHFPIALIAFAALFELFSKQKKNESLHQASVYNVAGGSILSFVSIATGIAAWLRLGYRLEGNLLIHLILASTGSLTGLIAWRMNSKPTYFILIGLSAILLLAAGHWGGLMVYPE